MGKGMRPSLLRWLRWYLRSPCWLYWLQSSLQQHGVSQGDGKQSRQVLEIAAGLEVAALRTLQLAAIVVQSGSAVWTGSFDLLQIDIRNVGRHAVCHPAALFQSIRRDGRE